MSAQELRSAAETRETVARYFMDYWGYTGATIPEAYAHADRILALLPASPAEGLPPPRAWHQLTDAERKEWNDGVMTDAGRYFQTFTHAYRLIAGHEMPTPKEIEDWNHDPYPGPPFVFIETAETVREDQTYPEPPATVMAGGQPVELHPFPSATAHRDQTEAIAKGGRESSYKDPPVTKGGTAPLGPRKEGEG